MAPTTEQVIQILREAGHVERCHIVPHTGSYSVAAHSWHVAVLLYRLHPSPSPNLIRAALMHDVPERYTGDVPASTKWANPQLAEALDVAEVRILNRLGELQNLTEEEQAWLFYTDKLELFLWCQDQWALGNSNVKQMICLLERRFDEEKAPKVIQDFAKQYCWRRTNDTRTEE